LRIAGLLASDASVAGVLASIDVAIALATATAARIAGEGRRWKPALASAGLAYLLAATLTTLTPTYPAAGRVDRP